MVLLTADTLSEAEGWRDWIDAAAAHLGAESVVLCDGRDVWQLARDEGMIPSSRNGFCTRVLKQELLDGWVKDHAGPDPIEYFGFDVTEEHRLRRIREMRSPVKCDAPLMWNPPMWPGDAQQSVVDAGLPLPAAYNLGLPHNNCLKYGCVKGGILYWRKLLHAMPEAYARSEAAENSLRADVGDHAILKDRSVREDRPDRESFVPLPLSELRRREEAGQPPTGDWGECGCLSLF